MTDSFKESALKYHTHPVPGKLEIRPTKPLVNKRDLSLAYSPGVAYACELIVENPTEVASVTARGNLVAVITNGTAVLGLGNIGPLASKPVMEGKAVLFKKFANIDVFDLEVDETDVDKLVDIIASLEPTFGGINLEDIKAPECFMVEEKLRKRMKIPVFHDDQHGTAIVAAAAIYNGLRVVDKKFEDVKLVVSGAGAASIACVDLLVSMGLQKKNVRMIDRTGVIYAGRKDGMNPWKEGYAIETSDRTIEDAIEGADLFMGLSGPGVLSGELLKKMGEKPIILAMSNPIPEIMPEEAIAARPDAIIATGRSDYPNQVNNVLCFPFIFRGALDCGASTINEEMKMAAVKAIADLATMETSDVVAAAYADEKLRFGPDYLIPKPFDPRLIEVVPMAVVKAAMASGVATRPIEDLEAYRQTLHEFVNQAGLFMQPIIELAKKAPAKIVYAEGDNDDVLIAIQAVLDEKIATPILIGRRDRIEMKIERLGLRINLDKDVEILNPDRNEKFEEYAAFYHKLVGRNGVSVAAARKIMHGDNTAVAAVMVARGEADGLICGKVGRFDFHLREIMQLLGPKDKTQLVSSVAMLLLPEGPLFLADTAMNLDPTAEELVKIAEASIELVKRFGIEPKVALLSHSNFGTSNNPSARKVRKAAEVLRGTYPDLQIDGEMHVLSALNPKLRDTVYAEANISGRANVLVLPNLDAANIAMGLIRSLTDALLIGPFINGFSKPAHIVIPSVSSRGIFNMTALTVADIQAAK
ncbi:MAG: malate dehydrogenase (oxaloacetate-decarboxylating)(NADP+) [Oceanospirillaceae bacterium]|jgi:malate dehydrogenase (oxaloacetate-decarboxylating)(NADP+)|tara:strand:+ start:6709 stop:8979 length:2271 start_codon:yes stop_codon:yes gene_type:complete